jgi:hypothetical protein
MTGRSLDLAGIVAAMALAAVVNVLSARHFTRWDWTTAHRWSLSPATLDTLGHLEQQPRIDVWAIAGPGDPLEPDLRAVLLAYQAASSRVNVQWIDPDRDTVQLVDLQRRYGIQAGAAVDGRVATDAIVVVARGDKHWFLTPSDLFDQTGDARARPREERALTQAIRSVVGGERARLCFTVGHGELSIERGKDERDSLGALRDLLEKNNYDLASVDAAAPGASEPFAGCAGVVLAGPSAPFSSTEATRLRAWLLTGGSLLAAVGPMDGDTPTGMVPAGLDEVLGPFGIGLDDVLVHDVDPSRAVPDTHGEGFFVTAKPHPVTASLVGGSDPHPPRVAVFFTRALHHTTGSDGGSAADLLVTSDGAYGKRSLVGAGSWTEAPAREATDPGGPFVVAMASERPRVSAGAARGPRVVVVGSRFALSEENWRQPRPIHGAAFFVDSVLSWLVALPEVVDVPEKPMVSAGIRVSEAGRAEVRRYVLVLMPLAALLLGAAVWSWRRSSEGKPYVVSRAERAPAARSP